MKTFSQATVKYLNELKENNNKEWFELNRSIYEEHLLFPLKHIASEMEMVMKGIDPLLETSPAVGKAVSRIYRDIRFSHDKTPYRTEAWVSFRRPKRIIENTPEFFLYFTTEEYQIGMGYYSPTPASMDKYRKNILLDPDGFGEFLDRFEKRPDLEVYGENYKKKVPNDLPERFQEWFQKKNIYVSRSKPIDKDFYSEEILKIMTDVFSFTSEIYSFMLNEDD